MSLEPHRAAHGVVASATALPAPDRSTGAPESIESIDSIDSIHAGDAGDASCAPESAARALRLLASGTPRQVAARLSRGDALELLPRVARELEQRCLLLDAQQVRTLLVARLAFSAPSWRGRPAWHAWLDRHLAAAIESALATPPAQALQEARRRLDQLAARGRPQTSAVDPAQLASALAAFHALALPERVAFFDLVVRGRDLDSAARAAGVSASEIGRRARRGLDACLAASGTRPGMPGPARERSVPNNTTPRAAGSRGARQRAACAAISP